MNNNALVTKNITSDLRQHISLDFLTLAPPYVFCMYFLFLYKVIDPLYILGILIKSIIEPIS